MRPTRGCPELSLVVPCFNEQERLPGVLPQVIRYLEQRGIDFELLLVDDGSSDGTGRLIESLQDRDPRIRALRLLSHRGKGRAVAEGVRASGGRLVLVSDADFSASIEELPKLERALAEGADVAFGSRAAPGAREVDQPLYRRLMGKAFNRLVQALLLPGVRDTQCGFKLFRGEVARELFGSLETDGFAYDVEVLLRARQAGHHLSEVPVRWLNSDSTRVDPWRHPTEMLRDLLRLRLRGT